MRWSGWKKSSRNWAIAGVAAGVLAVTITTWDGLAATNQLRPANADQITLAVTPPVAPPGAPQITSVTPASRALVVTWVPPTNVGGGPVTNYQAVAEPGGASCVAAAPTTTCRISGLNNGQRFTVTVRAANAGGYGPPSAPSAPVQPRP